MTAQRRTAQRRATTSPSARDRRRAGAGNGPGTTGAEFPDSHPDLELAEVFSHAARRLRHGSVAQLQPLGLTMAQSRILRLVAHDGPIRMADIAAAMAVVPRTVTPMVDGLVANGLVERQVDHADRRSVLVTLAPAGRRLLDGLDRARRASADQVFGVLDERERKQLLALLSRLCERGGCVMCCPEHTHHGPAHDEARRRGQSRHDQQQHEPREHGAR